MMRIAVIVFACLAFCANQIGAFGLEISGSEDIDSEIIREMDAHRIPSVAACIIKNDEIAPK